MNKINFILSLFFLTIGLSSVRAQQTDIIAKDSINLHERIIPAGDIKENNALLVGNSLIEDKFLGSWPMFGTNLRMKVGGYIKSDAVYDINGTTNKQNFLMSTIPVPGGPNYGNEGYFTFFANETRFNIDIRRIEEGKIPLKGFVEGDFFGAGGTFRLRHAYIVAGDFLIGQTWTTLSALESLVFLFDFAAGDALFGGRAAQIRYTKSFKNKFKLAIALENQPFLGIENPNDLPGQPNLQLPLLAARFDYSWSSGILILGSSVAQLRWDGGTNGPSSQTLQYDFLLAGRQYIKKKDYVVWNLAYGIASGENIMAFEGSNANATLNQNGELEPMPAISFSAGYVHKWNEVLASNLQYAYGWLNVPEARDPFSLKRGGVAHINLVYRPKNLNNFSTGAEYMFGQKRAANDDLGNANRIQFMAKYEF